jgi:hypothetical protein
MVSDAGNLLAEERLLPPADCNWPISDDGGGVGGMPRVYFASYKHTRPLDMHFAHGWSPLHFAFLDLQKSQARLTLRAFRIAGSDGSLGVSSMYSELLFWPVASGAMWCLPSRYAVDTGWIRFLLASAQRSEEGSKRTEKKPKDEVLIVGIRVKLRCTKLAGNSVLFPL